MPKKIDGGMERKIITAMIVSDKFLRHIQQIYDPTLMKVPYARTVAKWCLEYWNTYSKAPRLHIQDIFQHQQRNGLQDEQAELIEQFLISISDEHEREDKFNADYILHQAEEYFQSQNLLIVSQDIAGLLSAGQVMEAEARIADHRIVQLPQSSGVEPLKDVEAFKEVFEDDGDMLFRFKGKLGQFIGDVRRDSLISFLAPEKRGKTYWLKEVVFCALKHKCNVAYFDVGDMGRKRSLRRIAEYISSRSTKYTGDVKVPVLDCAHNQQDDCTNKNRASDYGVYEVEGKGRDAIETKQTLEELPDYKPCTYCLKNEDPDNYVGAVWHTIKETKRLSYGELEAILKRFRRSIANKRFKMANFPNDTLNVKGIRNQLKIWEDNDNFIPDVVVIDYADILAPESNASRDERHSINKTWKAMRSLAGELQVAVLTATQTDSQGFYVKTLSADNFSEDKRKFSHVNLILTLNQTKAEKADGIMRIGKMFDRDSEYDERRVATVLECRAIGRPYLTSYL